MLLGMFKWRCPKGAHKDFIPQIDFRLPIRLIRRVCWHKHWSNICKFPHPNIQSNCKVIKWNLPVWMYVCFFMSLFWWNRLPQNWHGYGRVSLCINKCVDNVLERLNAFPHCLHSNTFSTLWTALNTLPTWKEKRKTVSKYWVKSIIIKTHCIVVESCP